MSTPSARQTLTETLRLRLPASTYRIVEGPNLPANVTKPTILCWQDTLTRFDQIAPNRIKVDLVIWLLTGLEGPRAEDELEQGAADIITALGPLTWATWTQAERLTYGDSAEGPAYHSYRFTVSALAEIGD